MLAVFCLRKTEFRVSELKCQNSSHRRNELSDSFMKCLFFWFNCNELTGSLRHKAPTIMLPTIITNLLSSITAATVTPYTLKALQACIVLGASEVAPTQAIYKVRDCLTMIMLNRLAIMAHMADCCPPGVIANVVHH